MSEEMTATVDGETAQCSLLKPLQTSTVSLCHKSTVEELIAGLQAIDAAMAVAKDLKKLWEQTVLEWIKENHRDLSFGTIRYYAGDKKTTKCADLPGAVEALMQAVGGDFTAFCNILSTNAIKHGAASKVLDETTYQKFFKVEVTPELKEGKPVKGLQKIDTRFLR